MSLNYSSLGLKVGFEIHQQLDTKKLFCNCPPTLREDSPGIAIQRKLRPTMSELGEIDQAAIQEFQKGKTFEYQIYPDTVCLVEADEEPPYGPQEEAVDAALEICTMLNANTVDEIHFMRKIVIDGSNTSGFQRTSVVAMDGFVDHPQGRVRLDTFCLEEEAARKIQAKGLKTTYRLDRLGIPLIEIATAPDIKDPVQARDVALKVGEILRATGKVKRGIGTIRQDINVSIKEGARVEIKGVQDLKLIPQIIIEEIERQKRLVDVRKELKDRGLKPDIMEEKYIDISEIFKDSNSKIIKSALKNNGGVMALKLKGFKGLMGSQFCSIPSGKLEEEKEIEKKSRKRLGPEFAGYAKAASGVRGIFHIDELPAYGITSKDVDNIYKKLEIGPEDAFILVGAKKEIAKKALQAVFRRARLAFHGVPEETRMANPDGTSSYMRPLPGAARMYPETDIPPFAVSRERLERIRSNLPEQFEEKAERFSKQYGVNKEVAWQLIRSPYPGLFEEIVNSMGLPANMVATTLLGTLKEIRREGADVENLEDGHLKEIFEALKGGAIAKEALPQLITARTKALGRPLSDVIKSLGLATFSEDEARDVIKKVLEKKMDFIKEKGEMAEKPIMGLVMKEVRGRLDGKVVSRLLREEMEKVW